MTIRFAFGSVLAAAAATHVLAAEPQGKSLTAAETVERCKTVPDFCKALVHDASARARAAREACIPKETPEEQVAARVISVLDEVLEEDYESFKDSNYGLLAEQVISFTWPCGVVS